MHSEDVLLEGAHNFRDLGGHRTEDGGLVRYGVLFRSGHLAHLTDDDLAEIERIGIATVVDFRSRQEVELFGADRLPPGVSQASIPIGDHRHAPTVHRALEEGDFTVLPDLAEATKMMVREHAAEFGALMRLIADSHNLPLLFHCIGGKDRTGVAAALILSVLGVPWNAVIDDYLRTNAMMRGVVEEQIARLSAGVLPSPAQTTENIEALRRFFVVEASYIDSARTEIQRIAGSLATYATEWLGLEPSDIEALCTNLLVRG